MSLLRKWLDQHKPDEATETAIDGWQQAGIEPEEAVALLEAFEEWLEHKSGQPPDIVALIGFYGHTRLLLQDWRLPVDVPESEYDAWRAEFHTMTLSEFQDRLAEVVGGFMELGGRDPRMVQQILQHQLNQKTAELESLTGLPLDNYTPRFTSEALTAHYAARGLTGADLRATVGEHMADSDGSDEQNRLDRPFALRQELDCFEWGMEKFRLFAITEYEPEIGLPNKQLHEALMQIDLNELLARLEQADVKLRRIWQHLAKHNYYNLNVAYEPEQFWWRHWKKRVPRK